MSAEKSIDENELINRRDFFVGLKKWSKVVISSAIVGGALVISGNEAQAAWVNRRGGVGGGSWVDGGGGGWANRRGRGGAWIN